MFLGAALRPPFIVIEVIFADPGRLFVLRGSVRNVCCTGLAVDTVVLFSERVSTACLVGAFVAVTPLAAASSISLMLPILHAFAAVCLLPSSTSAKKCFVFGLRRS